MRRAVAGGAIARGARTRPALGLAPRPGHARPTPVSALEVARSARGPAGPGLRERRVVARRPLRADPRRRSRQAVARPRGRAHLADARHDPLGAGRGRPLDVRAARGAAQHERSAPGYRQLGVCRRRRRAGRQALRGAPAEPMSRPDVAALLVDAGIDPTGQRAYHLIGHHCMTGLLCQGPLIGKQPSFVLIDTWVPDSAQACSRGGHGDRRRALPPQPRTRSPRRTSPAGSQAARLRPRGPRPRSATGSCGRRSTGRRWLTHIDAVPGPRPPARRAPAAPVGRVPPRLQVAATSTLPHEHVARVVPGATWCSSRPSSSTARWPAPGAGRRSRQHVVVEVDAVRRARQRAGGVRSSRRRGATAPSSGARSRSSASVRPWERLSGSRTPSRRLRSRHATASTPSASGCRRPARGRRCATTSSSGSRRG